MQNPLSTRVPLAAAALTLGLTYQQLREAVLRGDVSGGRDEYGRLYVESADIDRYAATLGRAVRRGSHAS